MPLYVAHVADGLEALAAEDLPARLPRARVLETLTGLDGGRALLLMRHGDNPGELPALPLLDDLGLLLLDTPISGGWSGLRSARTALANTRDADQVVALAATVLPGRTRRATFHAAAWLTGEHAFLRSDLQHAVAQGVGDRFPQWQAVRERPHFTVQADLVGERLIVALRLGERGGRPLATTLPGTPRASVAAALVRLTQPGDGDTFLDPLCGAGALLVARGEWGRYRRLLGGDPDAEAVAAARANIGPRYKPITIERWDPGALPLDAGSVEALATVLPAGTKSAPAKDPVGIDTWLREWRRVLAPDARLALLAQDRRGLDRALARTRGLEEQRRLPIVLRGRPAVIVALWRPAGG